jgi:hypothetical protein
VINRDGCEIAAEPIMGGEYVSTPVNSAGFRRFAYLADHQSGNSFMSYVTLRINL